MVKVVPGEAMANRVAKGAHDRQTRSSGLQWAHGPSAGHHLQSLQAEVG